MEPKREAGGRLNMMRTIEVLIVIIIITGALITTSFFAVLPWPRQVSPVNLRRLSLTTLQALDSNYELSRATFDLGNGTLWTGLNVALSASLPPNVIYNLTIYNVNSGESAGALYTAQKSISNANSLGITSDSSSYLVASSNVTFNVTPEKIGESSGSGLTLYILNCSDANGWWITGYTAQSLAADLYKMLSPYFVKTVMVQDTTQLGQILSNSSLQGETVQNAVVINTFGEAVPIPSSYCQYPYSGGSYANYSYTLGQKVRLYNWTWASIVGWPFYYVSNTERFSGGENGWGIYGMQQTGPSGLGAFLHGLDSQGNSSFSDYPNTGSPGVVSLSSQVVESCNYYGIYPSELQTSTRALPTSIRSTYHLSVGLYVFNQAGDYLPGAIYNHIASGSTDSTGSLLALGLTRTPDVRLTALGLLSYYHPRLYSSDYDAGGTSRLAVLQLGLVGGV
jgi:hypothetical protein